MAESYEESLEMIRKIVDDLESGDLSLEDSVKAYSEGLKLLKSCYTRLNKAEKKLEELTGTLENIAVEKTELK